MQIDSDLDEEDYDVIVDENSADEEERNAVMVRGFIRIVFIIALSETSRYRSQPSQTRWDPKMEPYGSCDCACSSGRNGADIAK